MKNVKMMKKMKKMMKYTGLEHRQTLRALNSIVICKLKLKVGNLEEKLKIRRKMGKLEIIWEFGKNEIW